MITNLQHKNSFALVVAIALSILLGATAAWGQTSSFTYQGRLTDSGTAANGNYDLQFALFDSLSGGGQVGSTQTLNTVAVSNGVFTVSLDFGSSAFNGASRFLEISARPAGSGSFTLLSPRQQITSTPYAVRSLNASSADSVPASGVPAGSGNYIQNSASPQASSNFNISGNGTAGGTFTGNIVNAATQYNLNGSRILSNPGTSNLFAGTGAGAANTTGFENAFFGRNAGVSNTTGSNNAFFGGFAGDRNTTGSGNAFFGRGAGDSNTTGRFNAFFGDSAGLGNANGNQNTFVGALTKVVGESMSPEETTLLGYNAAVRSGPIFNPKNATAIGANAQVDNSNSLVLGSINGINFATADTNVGIGTTAPTRLLHLKGLGSNGLGNGDLLVTGTGDVGSAITLEATGSGGRRYSWISTASQAGSGDPGGGALAAYDLFANAYRMVINSAGNVGIGTTAPDQRLSVGGNASKSSGGTTWVVFSDERLKNIKGRFTPGLKALLQLQPIRFQYKRDNALNLPSGNDEVGFSAQAVQRILPEAVSRNKDGYLQLQSDPILWTMLNAIKEQQAQIQQLKKQIRRLRLNRRRAAHRR